MKHKLLFKKKSIITTALCVGLTLCISVPSYAVPSSQMKKEQSATQKKLDSAKAEVSKLEEERAEEAAKEAQMQEQLVSLLGAIDILEEEMVLQQQKIDQAQSDYDEAKATEEKQYESMKKRIRYMYEHGETQYVELFLASASIADAINKADYVEKIYDYDRDMLEEYQKVKQEAATLKIALEEDMDEMVSMEESYKEEQAELEQTISEQKAVVENFDSKLVEAKSAAKRYEQTIKKQNEEIAKQVAAEKAAAEAAAKKKAEEEAKKKAAEIAAKKAAEDSSSGNTGNNEEYADEEAGEPEKESAPSYSASGSGKGSDIANYGLQFVGNPYVAGGTSLTNGCDCSGFTQAVYSHFGYSIPRTSGSQAGYGKSVSYSEAQAGDIFCYAGHVGIYLGNGTIVHASTPASGIKVTTATYRPILSIRRIV